MKNNLNLVLTILFLLAIGCACPKPDDRPASSAPSISPSASSSPANSLLSKPANLSISSITASNKPATPKPNSSKMASVITENAYLRQSPNGPTLQTLPLAATVEVIQQKGPWFYVAYGDTKGWMHGNTIRYQNSAPDSTQPLPPSRTEPKRSADEEYRTPVIDKTESSGATARCRDGTLSYSAHRRGTCSHHGGVAVWY